MIVGEAVTVYWDTLLGYDDFGEPITLTKSEVVGDVLVSPGPRSDIDNRYRPDGVVVVFNLHFPKPYSRDLTNCRISVRGQAPLHVIGSPQHYTLENTPTRWWMPVEVSRAEG